MRMQDSGLEIQENSAEYPWAAPLHPESPIPNPVVRSLGLVEYQSTWDAMKTFTAQRNAETRDEIWLLQHPPTFTQGQAGLPEHLLDAHGIPVVKIDRGGQITYHAPGQIVAYLLLDMRRWKINVRELVRLMEQSVIEVLAEHGITALGREDAPGVYVGDAKIAALGLKIRHGCCYHGLSLNVDMDMAPFSYINPCGYQGLRVTQAKDQGIKVPLEVLQERLAVNLSGLLQRHMKDR